MIWATRTDSLPCDLPVFISKLSECKQVEQSTAFPPYFEMNLPIIHSINFQSPILLKLYQKVKLS